MEPLLSWLIGLDGGCVSAIALWVAIYHIRHRNDWIGTISAFTHSYDRAAYALSYTLAIALLTIVAIWDLAHPMEQFPYNVRMGFTIPVFILGSFAMFKRLRRRPPD